MIQKLHKLKEIINEGIAEDQLIERYEEHNILLGKHVSIGKDCRIGDYSYIGSNTKIEHSKIGRYVSIGDNCTIAPGEHRIKLVSTSYKVYKNKMGSEYYNGDDGRLDSGVKIGNDVWIGCNVTIRRGVIIGNGVVVGANSFVNKDIPDYAVVGGVPSKIIKFRFEKELIDKLLQLSWWDYELDEARKIIEDFNENEEINR